MQNPVDWGNFDLSTTEDNKPSIIALNDKKWSTMHQLVQSELLRIMNTKSVNNIKSECD